MKKSLRLGFCAVIASLALSSPAWAQFPELDTGGSLLGANGFTIDPYEANFNFGNAVNSLGGNLIKFDGIMNTPQASWCLEMETFPGTTANPDTRLYIQDSGGNYLSVNDDFGGTLQSKARYWFNPSPSSLDWVLAVGAYNSAHNGDDFTMRYTRRDLSESACTTGQTTIPWAKFVGGGSSFTVTLSPNHT